MKLPAVSFTHDSARRKLTIDIPYNRNDELARLVEDLPSCQLYVELSKPHKPRTTGQDSQNHRLNSHIQQICEETGNDFDEVKLYCKHKAIPRGYPFTTLNGMVIPWSEKRLDTVQCSYLIDAINQLAAELGIVLRE